MSGLGYGTRGPLVEKLKQLVTDIQNVYEAFLDAQTLYEQGQLSEKEFFAKMGQFLRAFASLGFLSAKVIVELDNAIGKEDESRKPVALTRPAPTLGPDLMPGGVAAPAYKLAEPDSRFCMHCNARIPKTAKFCTSCGKPQG